MTAETYNAEPNLTLLCTSCHQHAHRGYQQPRKLLTPGQRAALRRLQAVALGARRLNITREEYEARRAAGERWCSVHKAWEPADRFGKSRATADGFATRCREGNREAVRIYQDKAYQRDYYQRNKERLNAYRREWQRRREQKATVAS